MKAQPFQAPSYVTRAYLSSAERSKIQFAVDYFDDTGLYGQFPEERESLKAWENEFSELLKKAQAVISEVSKLPEFGDFFKPEPIHMGWKINEVLAQVKNPPKGIFIWSINLNDNKNLGLVFTEDGKLVVITHQFQHQNEHTESFHWMLRHDEKFARHIALKMDSRRLHAALKILSDPGKARQYFRARIHAVEMCDY